MRVQLKTILLIFSLGLIFSSCQKEISIDLGSQSGGGSGSGSGGGSGTGTNSIIGDYDFIDMTAHTSATVEVTDPSVVLKTITTSDYISKNNNGTVKVTASQFIITDIAYDIDTVMHVKTYMNGLLIDDSDFPFVMSSPPTSSTSAYTKISADSITVTGALGVPSTPTGSAPTGPVGAKLTWNGDTLTMKVTSSFTQSISQAGVPATLMGSVIGITRLKKK